MLPQGNPVEYVYLTRPSLGHLDPGSLTLGAGGARRYSSAEEGVKATEEGA